MIAQRRDWNIAHLVACSQNVTAEGKQQATNNQHSLDWILCVICVDQQLWMPQIAILPLQTTKKKGRRYMSREQKWSFGLNFLGRVGWWRRRFLPLPRSRRRSASFAASSSCWIKLRCNPQKLHCSLPSSARARSFPFLSVSFLSVSFLVFGFQIQNHFWI